MLHPNSNDVSSYVINMDSTSIEYLSVIDAKIESKILEAHERFKEYMLNTIDEKIEKEAKKNKYLFSQLNKKYNQVEEETKKINQKMSDDDKQSETLRELDEFTAYDMRKLHHDNIEQGKFNQEISSKVSMIDYSSKQLYVRLGDFLENFERRVLESMNKKFDGLAREVKENEKNMNQRFERLATDIKEISNRIDEVEKSIIKTKNPLEHTVCVNKTETDQKLESITSLIQENRSRIDSIYERIAINDQKCHRFEKIFDSLSEVLKQPR